MKKSICLNGRIIEYELIHKRVKNINLRIKSDLSVTVSSGSGVPLYVIENFMTDKADFILASLDKYSALIKTKPQPILFQNGDIITFLGMPNTLKVQKGASNSVCKKDSSIILTVKDISDIKLKKKVVDAWLREECILYITESCKKIYPQFEKYGVKFPVVKFRKMASRWGSCQARGGIVTFNTSLIKAPKKCIDYVIYHEFTHFLYADHSKNFYSCLAEFVPDYKECKKELEKYATL